LKTPRRSNVPNFEPLVSELYGIFSLNFDVSEVFDEKIFRNKSDLEGNSPAWRNCLLNVQ
jgi:hypothetical protein